MPDDQGRINLAKVSVELAEEFQEVRGDRKWEPFLRDVLDAYLSTEDSDADIDAIREVVREQNEALRRDLLEDLQQ